MSNVPPPDPNEEQEADALLKAHHAADDEEYPAYPEEYIKDREQRRGTLRLIDDAEDYFAEPKPVTNLFDVNWKEIRRGAIRAGVSERQMLCLEWRKIGWTLVEIAEEVGCSAPTVHRELKRAAIIIQRIPDFALYTVLAEVFGMPVDTVRWMCKHVRN